MGVYMGMITEVLDTTFGRFKVFTNDKHITKHIRKNSMFHTTVYNWIISNIHSGSFLDIGANIGIYSVAVSNKLGCNVFSIEAHPETFELLKYNASNNSKAIHVFNIGASNVSGCMYMSSLYDIPNFNTGDMRLSDSGKYKVNINRMDSVLDMSEKIDVIKIDTQGHDYKSLIGCELIIKKYHPAIIIEWEPEMATSGSTFADVTNYLTSHNYVQVSNYDRDYLFKKLI